MASFQYARVGGALVSACLGLLAACGGGGGGDAPAGVNVSAAERAGVASAGSDINAGNYAAFGATLARAVAGATSTTLSESLQAGRKTALATTPSGVALPHSQAALIGKAVSAAARRLAAAGAGGMREQPALLRISTEPCAYSGSTTLSLDDANNNLRLDSGDAVVIDANNCRDTVSDPPTSGRLSLTVIVSELDSAGNVTAIEVVGRFTNFSVGGLFTIDGTIRFSTEPNTRSSDVMRFSFDAVTVVAPNETVFYNFDLYGDAGTDATVGSRFVLQGALGMGGQSYRFSQPAADGLRYASGASLPDGGTLTLQDAAGDRVTFTPKAGNLVDLAFVPAGASTATATLPNQTWDALLAR
jgi:hypothetical protein